MTPKKIPIPGKITVVTGTFINTFINTFIVIRFHTSVCLNSEYR